MIFFFTDLGFHSPGSEITVTSGQNNDINVVTIVAYTKGTDKCQKYTTRETCTNVWIDIWSWWPDCKQVGTTKTVNCDKKAYVNKCSLDKDGGGLFYLSGSINE